VLGGFLEVKVLATNVDGTLTDPEYKLSLEAIKYVRILEEKGLPVILVSGNTLCTLKTLQRYIGCSGALVAENGAVVEYKGKLKILGNGMEARKALEKLKEKFGSLIVESWTNPYRYVDIALQRTLEKDKILDVVLGFSGLKLLDSGFAYHLLDKNVDKGKGLKVAVQLMGFRLEEVAVVGDSETDIEMFKVAGLKFAPANSPQNLKNIANHVTSKNGGEGFVEATKIILGEKTG